MKPNSIAGLQATVRFARRVDSYRKSRPGYPSALYDRLLEGHVPGSCHIVELGSGTGIFCRELLRRGFEVSGIEPNAEMRGAAEETLSGYANFTSIAGCAENTTLSERSADLVVSAQAFHWFDFAQTRLEVERILRPRGTVAWVWNSRRVAGSAFSKALEAFLLRWGTDYEAVRATYEVKERLGDFFSEARLDRVVFENHQILDLSTFRERILSASYMPGPNEPAHLEMLAALAGLFEEHQENGTIRLELDAELFRVRSQQELG